MARRKRYRCILADPPWKFNDRGTRLAPSHSGHYQEMDLSDIIGLGAQVRAWAAPRCHLWLCAPNAFVLDGTAQLVARAWGFFPKQLLTWEKVTSDGETPRIGGGHWMRNSTEQIVFCTRGQLPPCNRNVPTHVAGPVTRHSAKPRQLFDLVRRVSPTPRLEMFARETRRGWDAWGDEAPNN